MRLLVALLVILPLLSVVATAQAETEPDPRCILFIEPSPDFRTVRVRADLLLTDEERANLTAELDADGSGQIDFAEVAAYEERQTAVVIDPSKLGAKALFMDGSAPNSMTVYRRVAGWDRSPVNVTVTEHRLYDFPPPLRGSGYGHFLSGGLYALPAVEAPRPVVETVILIAPPGWVVWNVENLTNPAPTPVNEQNPTPMTFPTPPSSYASFGSGVRYESRQVELPSFDAGGSYVVGFSREGVDPTQIGFNSGPRLVDTIPFLVIGGIGALIIVGVILVARRLK